MMRTVAVIGAGAGGLSAVKCCLDEGLEPTCFERTGYIGGLWHYTEEVKEGHITVMKNTVANSSKEVTAFSDFPPAPEHPIYWRNKHFEEYLHSYAEHFDLKKHIRLNMEAVHIYETDDHNVTGRWNVKVNDISSGHTELFIFDAVLVCSGVFQKPIMPHFPGMDNFKGRVIHTQRYKDSKGFEDKRVLVVGVGNSAVDAAVDVSDVSSPVFISSRNGTWLLTRLNKRGHPVDMALFSRFSYNFIVSFPSVMNKLLMDQCNNRIDHFTYGINPKNTPAKSTSTVNDLLAYKLLLGEVKMKPDIKRFTERDVEFTDGTRIENVDVVILGTGYLPEYPFVDQSVIGEDKTKLYLSMFPPARQIQTLATVGCFRIKGPVFPILEMQSRLATKVFKGDVKLPDHATMLRHIEKSHRAIHDRVYSSPGVTQINYFPYMDELASMIGCKPSFWKLLLTDRVLAKKYCFGPVNSYQYRLMGPGAWSGAREAILKQWERTYYSINQGKMPQRKKSTLFTLAWMCVLGLIAVMVYRVFVQ